MSSHCAYCNKNLEIHGSSYFSIFVSMMLKLEESAPLNYFCDEDHMLCFVAARLGHSTTERVLEEFKNFSKKS